MNMKLVGFSYQCWYDETLGSLKSAFDYNLCRWITECNLIWDLYQFANPRKLNSKVTISAQLYPNFLDTRNPAFSFILRIEIFAWRPALHYYDACAEFHCYLTIVSLPNSSCIYRHLRNASVGYVYVLLSFRMLFRISPPRIYWNFIINIHREGIF